jgi:hypothetical protein
VTNHTLFVNSCLSSLHLLPDLRSSERCPQLGGCRPLPRSESSIERIRILVAEQKCHFRDIHLRPVEVLVRQFLPPHRPSTRAHARDAQHRGLQGFIEVAVESLDVGGTSLVRTDLVARQFNRDVCGFPVQRDTDQREDADGERGPQRRWAPTHPCAWLARHQSRGMKLPMGPSQ